MEEVIQTVKHPLRSTNKKNRKVRRTVSHYDNFIRYLWGILPSYDDSDISTKNMSLYRNMKNGFEEVFNNNECNVTVIQESIEDVVTSYDSSKSNNGFRVKTNNIKDIVKNDSNGNRLRSKNTKQHINNNSLGAP